MRVDLSSLERSGGQLAHNYAPGELLLDDERVTLSEPPRVSGRVVRQGEKVLVEGQVVAVAQVECDRCLKPLTLPINTEFRVEYVTTETYESLAATELGDEDLTLSVFDGESIDVDEIVSEQLLLAVPAQAFCKEDCKGLCPICGVDQNVSTCECTSTETDPRWAALKDLRF